MKSCEKEIVGLIPSGGLGTRMSPFKGWKELINVGYRSIEKSGKSIMLPKIIGEYILENMMEAGVNNFMLVINDQKYEVLRYFGDGSLYGVNIGYCCQNIQSLVVGMPVAIDTAYEWIKNKTVFMGMPDTIIEPNYSFSKLLKMYTEENLDLVLAVMPTDKPEKLAPVDFDDNGRIIKIYDKPKETEIYNTWTSAIWSPKFTELLHHCVEKDQHNKYSEKRELLLSDMFSLAVEEGLEVGALYFPEGAYYDMGDLNIFMETLSEINQFKIGG